MYFSVGWPKEIQACTGDILCVEFSPTQSSLLAVLTTQSLSIFSSNAEGFCLLASTSIHKLGSRLVWKYNSSLIAVQGAHSNIVLFEVNLKVDSPSIKLKRTVDCMYGKVNCMTTDQSHILVGTSAGYIVLVLWSGDIMQAISPDYLLKIPRLNSSDSLDIFETSDYQSENSFAPEISVSDADTGASYPPRRRMSTTVRATTNLLSTKAPAHQRSLSTVSVYDIAYSKELGVYAIIMGDGTLAFLTRVSSASTPTTAPNTMAAAASSSSGSEFMSFEAHYAANVGAVSISFNYTNRMAAVGCQTGEVLLYEVMSESLQAIQLRQKLSLHHYCSSSSPLTTTPVTTPLSPTASRSFVEEFGVPWRISFSGDGKAVCVGFSKRGMALFHTSGVCIMSTLPRDAIASATSLSSLNFTPSPASASSTSSENKRSATLSPLRAGHSNVNSHINELLPNGVISTTWNSEGYHLIAAPMNSSTFLVFSFYKSILCRNPSQNINPWIVLQGADRLLLFYISGTDLVNADWEHLQIPSTYIAANYPIKYVSVSSDGQQFVASGVRGCILYNKTLKRWRMFGDESQERSIKSYGVAWIDNVVFALVNRNTETRASEVLLFPRHHLDFSSVLGRLEICRGSTRVKMISATNQALLIYDSAQNLHVISVLLQYSGNDIKVVKFESTRKISLAALIGHPLCITLLPSATVQGKCLILHLDRKLTVFDLTTGREEALEEKGLVDQFWIESEIDDRLVLFTYGQSGVNLRIAEIGSSADAEDSSQQNGSIIRSRAAWKLIDYDSDSSPLGVVKEIGIFLHASEGMTRNSCSPHHCYEIQTRMYPYVHAVLLILVLEKSEQQALQFARTIAGQPTFTATLEWMLHSILEDYRYYSSSTSTTAESTAVTAPSVSRRNLNAAVPFVVDFLKLFPQFYDIIISCLRKTDISLWSTLFASIGQPRDLFRECLRLGLLLESAYLLRILQETEGLQYVVECAQTLLQPVIASHHYELARDLIRFIRKIESELKCFEESENRTQQQIEHKTESSESEAESEASTAESIVVYDNWLDMILYRQCRILLVDGNVRELARLAHTLELPLNHWLKKERDRAARLVAMSDTKSLNTSADDSVNEYETDYEIVREECVRRLEEAFANIHWSFALPRSNQNLTAAATATSNSSALTEADSEDVVLSEHFYNATQYRLLALTTALNELKWLLKEFFDAECMEWSLLFATVLCNVDVILFILRKSLQSQSSCQTANARLLMYRSYARMLSLEKNRGYSKLLHHIRRQLAPLVRDIKKTSAS